MTRIRRASIGCAALFLATALSSGDRQIHAAPPFLAAPNAIVGQPATTPAKATSTKSTIPAVPLAPSKNVGSGPYNNGTVIQNIGSGTAASRVLNNELTSKKNGQIQFNIQVLKVDSATRDKIYETIGPQRVDTEITQIDNAGGALNTDANSTNLFSAHRTTTGSVVSSAVIEVDKLIEILKLVKANDSSAIIGHPVIIAGDGQVAAIRQTVQRPFLSELEEVQIGTTSSVRSEIHVLDEGVDLAVQADILEDSLKVSTKIKQSRVTNVQQQNVYGIGDSGKVVQIPSHEVRIAAASKHLQQSETLLLDPYLMSTETKVVQGTPALEGIPYVDKLFQSNTTVTESKHVIMLLTAKKLPKPIDDRTARR